METELKSGLGGLSFGYVGQAKRQEQFEISKELLETLKIDRVNELAIDIRPRLGLAAKNIILVERGISSLAKFIRENNLADEYSGTLRNLETCKIELRKQFQELAKSARESNELLLRGETRKAVLVAEPGFNLRSGNSVSGLIEETTRVLPELEQLQELLRKPTRSIAEKYRLLVAPLLIKGDLVSLVREHPAEFTTPKNVEQRSAPPEYVEKALSPVAAGVQAARLGLSLAVTLQLLGPEPTRKLKRLIGNSDDEYIALPKQPFMDAKLREEGERAYRELLIGDPLAPNQKFEKGYISEEKPKGYFNFPGARDGNDVSGVSKLTIPPPARPRTEKIILSSDGDDNSNPPSAQPKPAEKALKLDSNRGEKSANRGWEFPSSVKVTRENGESVLVEKNVIVMFPPGVESYERAMKSSEYLFRLMRELLRVELENTGDLTGDSLKSVFIALVKMKEVASQTLFEAVRLMASREPQVFSKTVNYFESQLERHKPGEPLHELQLLFTVVVIGAAKSSANVPAELVAKARALGERYFSILEQHLSDEPVSLQKLFLIIEMGAPVGIKPTARMEGYMMGLMSTADITNLSKGISFLPGKGEHLPQQEFSIFLNRLLTIIRERDYGGETRAKGDDAAIKSLNILLKLGEGKLEIVKEQLDEFSKFVCELKGAPVGQVLPTMNNLFKVYRRRDLSPSPVLVERIFASDLKQSRELQIGLIGYLASKGGEFADVVAERIRLVSNKLGKTATRQEKEIFRDAQTAIAGHLAPKPKAVTASQQELPQQAPITVKPETAEAPQLTPPLARSQPPKAVEVPVRRSYFNEEILMIVGQFSRQTPRHELKDIDVALSTEDLQLTSREILDVIKGFANGEFIPRRSSFKLLNGLFQQLERAPNEVTPIELFNLGDALLRLQINDPRLVSLFESMIIKDPEVLKRLPAATSLAIRYVLEYGEELPKVLSEESVIALSRSVSLGYRVRLAESLVRLRPSWSNQLIRELFDQDVTEFKGHLINDSTLIKLHHLSEYFGIQGNTAQGKSWKQLIGQALQRRIDSKKPELNGSELRVQTQLENRFGSENVDVEDFLPGLGYRIDYIVRDPLTKRTVILEMDGREFHETLKIEGDQVNVWKGTDSYTLIRETLLKRKGVVVHLTWEEIKPFRNDENWLPNRLREAVKTEESRPR